MTLETGSLSLGSHSNFTQSLIQTFPFARSTKEKPTTIRLCACKYHRDNFALAPKVSLSVGLTARRGCIHDYARHHWGSLCAISSRVTVIVVLRAWTSYLSNIFLREDCLPRLASARYIAGPFTFSRHLPSTQNNSRRRYCSSICRKFSDTPRGRLIRTVSLDFGKLRRPPFINRD